MAFRDQHRCFHFLCDFFPLSLSLVKSLTSASRGLTSKTDVDFGKEEKESLMGSSDNENNLVRRDTKRLEEREICFFAQMASIKRAICCKLCAAKALLNWQEVQPNLCQPFSSL